jgi:hypothetical protein
LEDEGIPDMQDGTPQQQWANDPQEQPVPGDEPIALDDYGTTADEQREPESLDGRLAREEPAEDVTSDPGGSADPEGSTTAEYPEEGGGPVRGVAPDQGVAPDTEKDMIAKDVGPDTGGYGPEERALRVEGEPEDAWSVRSTPTDE